jgi:hypothetical protein
MSSSGIVIGVLKEQHADHIILADASRVSFPEGLVLDRLPSGSSVTILYSRNNAGEVVVQSITRSATSHLRHLPPPPATDHRRWGYTDAGNPQP